MDNASLGSRGGNAESEEAVPCRPVLKITRSVLIGYENSLLYLILEPLTRTAFCSVLLEVDPF
jgi:hypothetical protein